MSRHEEHFESAERQTLAAHLGVWLFLASELLLFAGLLGVYCGYRLEYRRDFSLAAEHNDLTIGTVNTLVLITSSFCAVRAVRAARGQKRKALQRWLLFTLLLGGAFLALKSVEWAHHFSDGILPGTHYAFAGLPTRGAALFFTLYYLLTGLHAIHVIGGMTALAVALWLAARRASSPPRTTIVELSVLYWHLVDVIWIFLWPLLYLVR